MGRGGRDGLSDERVALGAELGEDGSLRTRRSEIWAPLQRW